MAEGRTRRFLLTGFATLLPTLLTIFLLAWVLRTIHGLVGVWVNDVLKALNIQVATTGWAVIIGDAVAFLLFLGICWGTGFFVATYLGGVFFRRLDKWFRRVPLIRIVYPAVKQVSDFFLAERTALPFSGRVVAVPYPRQGVYSLGFTTGAGLSQLKTAKGERLISVFIPNSPAPMTGFTVFVPREDVIPMNLTVDDAIKLVVSGGVVVPDREAVAAAPLPQGLASAAPPPVGLPAEDSVIPSDNA